MKQQRRQKLTGRKRKLSDKEEPPAKRLKTSPKATNINTLKEQLFNKYHTKFSWTFFKFWEFIQSITEQAENPLNALNIFDLKLVGPFEYLHGDLSSLSDTQILTHYRYHFDLPELQTIIIETNSDNDVHYGLWRDDPNFNEIGICKADGTTDVVDKKTKMVQAIASNLFFFLQDIIQNTMQQKLNKKNKARIKSISNALDAFIATNKIKLEDKNRMSSFKEREKRIVTKTFSGFGLVVPMKDDIGYREIGYSVKQLKRILKRMNTNKTKGKRVDGAELEVILTNICLADDEGDPGMGYELGIDFFYSYPMFEKHAKRLLMNGYNLTKRHGFKKILEAHLQVRAERINGKCNELEASVGKKVDVKKNNNKKKKNGKQTKKITTFFAAKKNVKKAKKKNVKKAKKSLDDLSSESDDD